MPSLVKYSSFLKQQMNGGGGTAALVVDFDTDTIKIMLTTSTYTPSAAHLVKTSITNEVTGTGYTAGGATLTSPTLTETGGVVTFDAANVTWAQNAAGFSNARYAVLYKSTGVDATSALIGYYDLLTDQANTVVPFSLIFDSLGIITWS